MKRVVLFLAGAAILLANAADVKKVPRKRLTPAQEKASQFRAWEREDVKAPRRKKLAAWFARKASGKTYVIPEKEGRFADKKIVGFRSGDFAFAVDRKNGLPAYLSVKNSGNLLNNAVCDYPLWEIEMVVPGQEKNVWTGHFDGKFSYRFINDGMILIWETPVVKTAVSVSRGADGFALFDIKIKNLRKDVKLWTLDFPKLALTVPGQAADAKVVIPWRRGRLQNLTGITSVRHQEYPGSSARFQMTALYDSVNGDGRIFTAVDNEGFEKQFRETFLPEYNVLLHTLRRFPVNRGSAGNQVDKTFVCKLGVFNGDWYDAAKLYRAWWKEQKWSKRGPIYTNDTPEFLKHAPVYLRWYLRQSQNMTADIMERLANAWTEFLPGRKLPGTLYHYSAFVEPPNRKRYPVCEYYGFCADPFPGMVDALQRMWAKGIRPSVYLQSEIYNQFDSRNDALAPSLRLDINGVPRLYVQERYMACRGVPVWRTRHLEMIAHLKKMGFCGIYMDTFGKTKINHECFDVRHGHAHGGGNIDCEASRTLGKDVRAVTVAQRDQYIGGEASTEAFVDILDYKLNAVHAYNGMIPLERTLYGDYILSHGRNIRGSYGDDECRSMLLDFLEGVIFGRFFGMPPKPGPARDLLKKLIAYNDLGYEYMRTGEMLRELKFKDNSGIYKFTTEPEMHRNVKVTTWRNSVFRSYKDGSIGIAVAYLGSEAEENTLFIGEKNIAEWQLGAAAKIYRMNVDGKKEFLGTLEKVRKIDLKMPSMGVEVFVVEK